MVRMSCLLQGLFYRLLAELMPNALELVSSLLQSLFYRLLAELMSNAPDFVSSLFESPLDRLEIPKFDVSNSEQLISEC